MVSEALELPAAPESEIAVLGSLVLEPRCIGEVRGLLTEDDFHDERHRRIYRAVASLHDRGGATDLVAIIQELSDRHELEQSGGSEYVAQVIDVVSTAATVDHHARTVRSKADLRRLIRSCQETIHEAVSANGTGHEAVHEAAERRILEAAPSRGGQGYRTATHLVMQAMERVETAKQAKGGITGVPTGLPTLDRWTAGLQPGELTVVAARPGMGKSAMAWGIAEWAASKGHPTAIANYEMTDAQLGLRGLARRSGVPLHRLRRGLLEPGEESRLTEAGNWLSQLPLHIDDQPARTPDGLRAQIRRLQQRQPIELLVVDYLQLMSGEGESQTVRVTSISKALKALATGLGVHVLALSQLSRAPEQRTPHRPQLSDLRDSGSIEQDADNVLLFWRPEYYFTDETPDDWRGKWQGKGEAILAKQRNGETGTILLDWHGETTTFRELEIGT